MRLRLQLNKSVANIAFRAVLVTVFVISMGLSNLHAEEQDKLTFFAAASTTNAVTDICNLFAEKKMGKVTPSFASSSTLAKQIDQGAPADIYLSANPKWMNFLEKNKMIEPETRRDLLGNRIVFIAPLKSGQQITITQGFDLSGILGEEKLAMGDPDHVPAGIYGKQALTTLGVWDKVAPKVARSKDVRAALALVERGETPLGIVYSTDAAISKKVKVVAVFPKDSHPLITYPVAIVAGKERPVVRRFYQFLVTSEAIEIFKKYGFTVEK